MAQAPQTPIVNAGLKYVNGLDVPNVSGTTFVLGSGAARDSTNTNDIILNNDVTVNGLFVGVNGVDVAVLEADKFYAIYVIGDSTSYHPSAGLLSLNSSVPYLPLGYDMYRRVGWAGTNELAEFHAWWQYGNGQVRTYYYEVPTVFPAGTPIADVFVTAPIKRVPVGSLLVPPVEGQFLLGLTYTPAAADNVVRFRIFGSGSTAGQIVWGSGAAQQQTIVLQIPYNTSAGIPVTQYAVEEAGDTVAFAAVGFIDSLF